MRKSGQTYSASDALSAAAIFENTKRSDVVSFDAELPVWAYGRIGHSFLGQQEALERTHNIQKERHT